MAEIPEHITRTQAPSRYSTDANGWTISITGDTVYMASQSGMQTSQMDYDTWMLICKRVRELRQARDVIEAD